VTYTKQLPNCSLPSDTLGFFKNLLKHDNKAVQSSLQSSSLNDIKHNNKIILGSQMKLWTVHSSSNFATYRPNRPKSQL